MPVQPYSRVSADLLAALRATGCLKLAAFADYVKDVTGHTCTEQMVSQWCRSEQHFPADLVPVLAAFLGDDTNRLRVLRAYASPAGVACKPETLAELDAITGGAKMAQAISRLLAADAEARDPDSDGGTSYTDAEWDVIDPMLDRAIAAVEALRAARPASRQMSLMPASKAVA